MSTDGKGLSRFGGVAFLISGALFFTRYLLEVAAGRPPSTGAEILAWVATNRLALSLVSEVLFFASVLLVPGVIALYVTLAPAKKTLAATGCAIIAVVIPVVSVLLVVHGRLVYPVYNLRIANPAVAEFAAALFYGGMHAVFLLMAVATVTLSLAMSDGNFGRPVAALGFATAVGDVIGAYPDLISPPVLFACQFLFAAWFAAVGWTLSRIRNQGGAKRAAT